MNSILLFICVLSFFSLITLGLLLKNYKNKEVDRLDGRVAKIINILSFISTTFAVLTLIISIIGLIMQNKSPKLKIEIYTMHGVTWKEENGDKQLCLLYDDDGHVDFDMSICNVWYLHINNEGNQYAENVKIKIQFEDFGFISQPDSFILSDYAYGSGFYCAIERTFDQVIQPGETINVPYIPFDDAMIYDFYGHYEPDYTNMNIKIYENNSLVLEKNFFIEFVENSMIKDTCLQEIVYESDEDKIIRELNEFYFDGKPMGLYPKELAFSLEEYEIVYRHYLGLMGAYNPYTSGVYKRRAVFYGRLYYLSLSKEIYGINIEQAIQNDIMIR